MTDFGTLRVRLGRRPIAMVELDLDTCSLTYGVAPCTASLGTTGTAKCYNTFKTCQAAAAYSKAVKTYRFCSSNGLPPIGEPVYNCITDVNIVPTQLKLSGFSVSASVTVTLRDFPDHDRGIDPYVSERSYDPEKQGTFFGRLRARNPYLVNRLMRVNTGYIDGDRNVYTQTRTYFIDRMEGPDANGVVKLIGKDLLRFTDQDKAEAPRTSKGSLAAQITPASTSLTLSPAGVGAEYPNAGTVMIGDELIGYTSKSGDTLNGLDRASDGTGSDTHDQGEKVQLCLRYTGQTIPAVVKDLLTNYASIDASYIPSDQWEDEAAVWLPGFDITTLIVKPQSVKSLIEEIMDSAGCSIWWDELNAKLRFKVIVPQPASGDVVMFDGMSNILQGTMKVKDQEKDRLSRVVIYFQLASAVADVGKENFRKVYIGIDADSEGPNAYGTENTKTLLSRWIPNRSIAAQVSETLLSSKRDTPREVTLRVDAKDNVLSTGDLLDVQSRLIQGPDGLPGTVRYIVTETREVEVGTHYEYVCLQISSVPEGKLALLAGEDTADWTSATQEEKDTYMYLSDDDGFVDGLQPGPKLN